MHDIGNVFEIKRSATENNIVYQNLTGTKPTVDTHTHNPNMILNIIIKSKGERHKEGGKEKDLPEEIQNN